MPLFGAGGYKALKFSDDCVMFKSKRRYSGPDPDDSGLPLVVDLRKWFSPVDDQKR
jgi:hypothetical protein